MQLKGQTRAQAFRYCSISVTTAQPGQSKVNVARTHLHFRCFIICDFLWWPWRRRSLHALGADALRGGTARAELMVCLADSLLVASETLARLLAWLVLSIFLLPVDHLKTPARGPDGCQLAESSAQSSPPSSPLPSPNPSPAWRWANEGANLDRADLWQTPPRRSSLSSAFCSELCLSPELGTHANAFWCLGGPVLRLGAIPSTRQALFSHGAQAHN